MVLSLNRSKFSYCQGVIASLIYICSWSSCDLMVLSRNILPLLQELRGRHISLACFHGINFKSKSWALFSLKDPSISFVSDAQEIMEEKPGSCTINAQ